MVATAVRPVVSALVAPHVAARPLVVPARKAKRVPAFLRVPPLTEAQLMARYPHVIPGTLRYDPIANKNAVDIRCQCCFQPRTLYTSDLFHVRLCRTCKSLPGAKAGQMAARGW